MCRCIARCSAIALCSLRFCIGGGKRRRRSLRRFPGLNHSWENSEASELSPTDQLTALRTVITLGHAIWT